MTKPASPGQATAARGPVRPRAPRRQAGVFPWQELRRAAAAGVIVSEKHSIPDGSYQPASLDLRLGEVAHRLRCSFLPGPHPVRERLSEFSMGEVDLRDGAVLEQGRPYLIPLIEGLKLPRGIRGQTNPKSSTGRLDIFTRVITDAGPQFDEIAPGYEGALYLEVFSRTFTIKVRAGQTLNQLRLFNAKPVYAGDDLLALHRQSPLAYHGARPVAGSGLVSGTGLLLGVDLTNRPSVGFRAKRNSHLLELDRVAAYEAEDYWEEIHSESGHRLVLEPEEFYLLISREAVVIPPNVAADMVAFDPTSGELRTHYAGFFDPGFGYDASGALKGSRAVMEVRAHDVPFAIEDGQGVAKLTFSPMAAIPKVLYGTASLESHYQGQEALRILPKQFLPPRGRALQAALR